MRRASLFAPLLLIGLGVLFLARNLFPDLPLIDYLAKYWPVILITWGVLRLAEILFWAATSKPLPKRGVSGGEWALVFFLCLFGISLHTVRGFSSWWPRNGFTMGGIDMFGESFEYPLSGTKASSKTPHVVIESFRGNARIVGADNGPNGDEVKVTGHKTIRSLDQGRADMADKQSSFEIAGGPDQIFIRTNQDRVPGGERIADDLEVTVPKGASVEAHGRNGDFDVSGLGGSVMIVSDNAGVRLENIGGDARLALQRSDIVRMVNVKGTVDLKGRGSDVELQDIAGEVTISGAYTGIVQLHHLARALRMSGPQMNFAVEKVPGDVRIALSDFTASNLVGPVRLTTRSRDVQIGDFTDTLDVTVDRGDIELRPGKLPLSRMQVQTRSGNVQLSLPPSGQFSIAATATRGGIDNDFGSPLKQDADGRGFVLRGSVGTGPQLTIQADRGQIVVRKASVNDQPLTPHFEQPLPPPPASPQKLPKNLVPTKPLEKPARPLQRMDQ